MISVEELAAMSRVDICGHNLNLVDIATVQTDTALPGAERLRQTIAQMGNPYGFYCASLPVKMEFSATGKTLEQALIDYFVARKRG